jgi:hypothetical protein
LNGIVIDVISESANSADIDVTGDGGRRQYSTDQPRDHRRREDEAG